MVNFYDQVVNHGISETIIEEALEVNAKLFDMPPEMKEELISDDLLKPVRYSTIQCQAQTAARDFIKLNAHPFEDFVDLWPKYPTDYRYPFTFSGCSIFNINSYFFFPFVH